MTSIYNFYSGTALVGVWYENMYRPIEYEIKKKIIIWKESSFNLKYSSTKDSVVFSKIN
jgi:hypothetical protein